MSRDHRIDPPTHLALFAASQAACAALHPVIPVQKFSDFRKLICSRLPIASVATLPMRRCLWSLLTAVATSLRGIHIFKIAKWVRAKFVLTKSLHFGPIVAILLFMVSRGPVPIL